jgi:hypothetical protein
MGTTAVRQGGQGTGKNRAAKDGLLSTLDTRIMRHQAAISVVTGILAVLGVGVIVIGLSRVSPLLKVLSPF